MTKSWQDRIQLGITRTANGLTDTFVAALRSLLFRRFPTAGAGDSIRRILIFRIGNIGDIVAATPVMAAIRKRFPQAHICLLTSPGVKGAPGARELISPGGLVDELKVYYQSDIATWLGRRQWLHDLRAGRFDLFIELSNILAPFRQVMRSISMARIAGCRYAVGFQVAPVSWFPRTHALHVPFEREAERLSGTLRVLGLEPEEDVRCLAVSPADRSHVRELLERAGISAGDPVIVMHVGAKRPANRWFADRFAAVADQIQTQRGIRVVLTGGAADQEPVDQVRLHMRTEPVIVCGQLNLLQTAALLERACLYVGNDTGPMHLSAAMGTPAVAIFSARDFPGQWYPNGNGHTVLRRDVPCSPCFMEVCDRGLTCLDLIQVDDVLRAIEKQLARVQTGFVKLS